MADTLLLDISTWDLVLDANGNIALASEPYSLAQDAASAIKTFLGECYWNTLVGIPWLTQILGQRPSAALVKAQLQAAALTVPDVASAQVFLASFNGRVLSGQVQVTSISGQSSAASFSVINPQGGNPPPPTPPQPLPPSSGDTAVFIPTVLTGI
jgi:hypothetical protein